MNKCRYCHKPGDYNICIVCDAKHTAVRIKKIMDIERNHNKARDYFMSDDVLKRKVFAREVKGLEGLDQLERTEFISVFEREYAQANT